MMKKVQFYDAIDKQRCVADNLDLVVAWSGTYVPVKGRSVSLREVQRMACCRNSRHGLKWTILPLVWETDEARGHRAGHTKAVRASEEDLRLSKRHAHPLR